MSNAIVLNSLKELKAFLDEKGVMEIAVRNQNKRFKTFQKVTINLSPETEMEVLAQKAVQVINRSTMLNERTLNQLGAVARMQNIGLLLNGLNLCATCIGFAIMYKQLDKLSAEINQQLYQLQKTMKQTQDLQNDYEFSKVLAEHTNMLDSQRRQQPYSEERMRELVDREYSVLALLVNTFRKDISGDRSALIFSIFSMLAMFTVSLSSFDELYYFNNRGVLGDSGTWHLSHEKWMGAYDTVSAPWFIEKLQDFCLFEKNLSTPEVDIYYISLMDQVTDLREEVEDNQGMLVALGDADLFRRYKELSIKEVADSIRAAFYEAGEGLDESVVVSAYNEAMKRAAIA